MSTIISDKRNGPNRSNVKADDSLSSVSFRRIRGIENLAAEFREGDGVPKSDERSRCTIEQGREKPNYSEARSGPCKSGLI